MTLRHIVTNSQTLINSCLASFESCIFDRHISVLYNYHNCRHKTFKINSIPIFFPHGPTARSGPGPPQSRGFEIRHTTLGRSPLDEWSALRRDFSLTTHNTHKRHPCLGGIRTHNPSKRAAADPCLSSACLGSASTIYFSFTLLVKTFLCSYLHSVFIKLRKVLHKGRYRKRSKTNFVPSIFTQLPFFSFVTRTGIRFTVNTVTATMAAVP